MKISQEARDAAALVERQVLYAMHPDLAPRVAQMTIDGKRDKCIHVQAMQSLINSTLERAAGVADAADMRGFRTGEAQTYIVTAIRQLIEE